MKILIHTMSTKKVYTNTIAQIGGKVITAIISIGLIKILTNYLDISGYGLYSKIYNYLSIFAVIADLWLYTITVREISHHKNDKKMVDTIIGNVLTLRTIFGGGIILLSLIIALVLPGYSSLSALIGIFIVSWFTLFGLINSSIMSLLQAYLQTEFSLISTTIGKITTFGLIAWTAYWFLPHDTMMQSESGKILGFALVMLAGLMGNMIMTLLTYIYASKIHSIRFRFDKDYIRHILWISLPYGIALFLNVIFFKVDIILLSILEPKNIADTSIALYSLPMKIVEVGMMYGTLFLNSMLPLLTEAIKQNSYEKNILAEKAYRILLLFGFGLATYLFTYADEVIHLIANKEYFTNPFWIYTSKDALQVVVWIFFFYFLSSLFTYILIAANEQRKMMYINSGIAGVNILGNILFIPIYSFIGSAYVTVITQILLLVITYSIARKYIQIRIITVFSSLIVSCSLIAYILGTYTSDYFWQSPLSRAIIGIIIFILCYVPWFYGIILSHKK